MSLIDTFVDENNTVISFKQESEKRHWFLTINQSAECFGKIQKICDHLNDKGRMDRWYHYAFIFHDKDTVSRKYYEGLSEENQKNYDLLDDDTRSDKAYAFKRPHYHVLLSFQDAKRWSKIKKAFVGAHVEVCQSVGSSFAYLTHDTPECIRQGKHKYSRDEIQTDSFDFFTKVTYSTVVYKSFDPALIPKYIFIDKMDLATILLNFGCVQTQRWLGSIRSCIECFKELAGSDRVVKNPPFYTVWDKEFGLKFLSQQEFEERLASNPYSVKFERVGFSQFGFFYVSYCLEHNFELITDAMKFVLVTSEEYQFLVEQYGIVFDLHVVYGEDMSESDVVVEDISKIFNGRELDCDEVYDEEKLGISHSQRALAMCQIDRRHERRKEEWKRFMASDVYGRKKSV